MTRKIPLTVALAALVAFAAPTLAAEHGAKHDPQVATTAAKAKGHDKAAPATKETKAAPVKGRKAKAKKTKDAAKTTATPPAQTAPAPAPAPAPAR